MCRKRHMLGWCMICLGLGILVGHCLESWFLCAVGGFVLVVVGFCTLRRR